MNASPAPQRLTPQQAKLRLRGLGKSVPQFCKEHGIDVQAAYDLLNGRQAGNRGKAHDAAVALGLKAQRSEPGPLTPAEERALQMAKNALSELIGLGVRPEQIEIKTLTHQPLIAIPPVDQARALGGACIWTLQCQDGILRCWVVAFHGCLIRWIENLGRPDITLEATHGRASEN